MIKRHGHPINTTLPLTVKTSLCANGETVEYSLHVGDPRPGDKAIARMFVNSVDTSPEQAVRRLLRKVHSA